jgi:hypothetical protein
MKQVMKYSSILIVLLVVLGCTARQVTIGDKPVTDETVKKVARAVATADQTAASIVHFLIGAHSVGGVSRDVLVTYHKSIGPVVQAALDESRVLLIRVVENPVDTPQETVNLILERLLSAVQKATDYATKHGWKGV